MAASRSSYAGVVQLCAIPIGAVARQAGTKVEELPSEEAAN
jgi:hypothetical protein